MRHRSLLAVIVLVGLRAALTGQTWTTPTTAWGHPDLQGTWSTATLTPFERPAELAGKEFFTEKEAIEFEQRTVKATNRDRRDGAGTDADVSRAYNDFWWDSGTRVVPTLRTSLLIDPRDGKMPPLTADAQKRQQARTDARALRGPADMPEDRNLWERCITRGLPNVMLPQVYNNNYQIFQTPGYVVILAEMIHDARIIPLDGSSTPLGAGRPHLPANVRQWMGDSVGRWEGDTLVVETTNFTDKTNYRGSGENLRLVERFTRLAPDVLNYEVTIDDPTTFTKPFTVANPARKSDGEIYEYACHEGNYGLTGILEGARTQEKAATEAAKKTRQ